MLTGQSLVYFGPEKWEGLWRNRHQLMFRFAQRNKVLYVEPKIYLQAARRQWRTVWRDLRQRRITQAGDNLYIYHSPSFIPIAGRRPLDRLTWFVWKGYLKRTLRELGFAQPIVWLSRPDMVNLAHGLNQRLVIYHIVDDYLAYHLIDHGARARQQALERQLLRQADLVIVVSDNLLKAKRPFNLHTYLVPNGVDPRAYMVVDDFVPPELVPLPPPRIGYSGLIGTRLDLALLREMALAHPEWSIILVGAINPRECEPELAQLRKVSNVHFLGCKEIDQIPDYVRAFDVCLIPYMIDGQSNSASPLKLYDYLATGKPIVTTAFAEAQQFQAVLRIAATHDDFIRHVAAAVTETDHYLSAQRQQLALDNTWDKRVEQLSDIIASRLGISQQR